MLAKTSDDLTIRRQRTRLGGATVYSEMAGEGHPLILVHGLSGSTRWWSRNVAALAQHFEVHIIDLLGFGGSHGHRFALQEAAEYLHLWLEAQDIERPHLVGHSMGGFISVAMVGSYPDSVDRLVLVDAAIPPFWGNVVTRSLSALQEAWVMPWRFWPVVLVDGYRAGPRTVAKAALELAKADLPCELHAIEAPTLVVWGERDRLLPRPWGEAIARQLPHAQFVTIPRAAHSPMWERPAEFNALVLDWLIADLV